MNARQGIETDSTARIRLKLAARGKGMNARQGIETRGIRLVLEGTETWKRHECPSGH